MSRTHGDWLELGSADENKPAKDGTLEAWARSKSNPVGGWYEPRKGSRGRFAMYVPPLLEELGLVELEHNPRNNRIRARSDMCSTAVAWRQPSTMSSPGGSAPRGLTSAPLADPADVVRLLVCAQSQDAPLARFSIGMRTKNGTDESVRDAINGGRILRTHILRPTWHYVAPADLVWLLDVTSAKVESSLAARQRNLDLDANLVSRTHVTLGKLLAGRRFLTRRSIASELQDRGHSFSGEQLGHLLLLAELRGLICSGPLDGDVHTYGLVDELVPRQAATRDRDDAVRELVARFFAGHGPAAITDLTRWTKLTQTEIRTALVDVGDPLETMIVDGVVLHFDAGCDAPETRVHRALLMPLFDEAYLTYPKVNVPQVPDHPSATLPHRFAEASGGVVVCDRQDVGWWKRTNRANAVDVSVVAAPRITPAQRDAIAGEARRLAAFTGREPVFQFV